VLGRTLPTLPPPINHPKAIRGREKKQAKEGT